MTNKVIINTQPPDDYHSTLYDITETIENKKNAFAFINAVTIGSIIGTFAMCNLVKDSPMMKWGIFSGVTAATVLLHNTMREEVNNRSKTFAERSQHPTNIAFPSH